LRHAARFFTLPAGYYGLEHILMLLGMLALCRIKSIEQLRSSAPGEWGELLGLDRCPEAKTLRGKIKLLTTNGDGKGLAAYLADALAIGSTLRLIDGLSPGMAVDPSSGNFCVLMPCRCVGEAAVEPGVGQVLDPSIAA